ncbi:type VI secretion system protein TssA [Coralloluteibacterium thermophilus]|uniref:Type VI secretion system protein TssA n=1 Tax=Coralloluteibacterium thermophilum TaxID=2707049 RepID=A0ABV9NID5_9GAMM
MSNEHGIEALLAPLGDEAPAGTDLEYDPEFLALETAATPKAERAMGDSVIAAEEPDWARVEDMALALFRRTRDLRVAAHLCSAWVRRRGLGGWNDGLALVRGLLEQHWEHVHPQLDAEDDDDPTARVNAVLALTDLNGPLGCFRTTPFVQSPRLGRFSLRDLRIANGSIKPAGADEEGLPTLSEIEACCLDCAPELLEGSANAVAEALAHARAIDALFMDRIGTAAPDLKPLLGDLHELHRFVQPQWAARGGAAGEGDGDEVTTADAAATPAGAAAVAAAPARIASAADVVKRIDEICEYYARAEPSSPVPILLRRAQRLVGRNFMELLQDLAPGGMSELQHISGPQEE